MPPFQKPQPENIPPPISEVGGESKANSSIACEMANGLCTYNFIALHITKIPTSTYEINQSE